MDVQTDHQIVSFPPDSMLLFDNETGTALVTAQRTKGVWTLKADKHKNVKVPATPANEPPRQKVIQAMVDLALEISPRDGYSTVVPHGLRDMP